MIMRWLYKIISILLCIILVSANIIADAFALRPMSYRAHVSIILKETGENNKSGNQASNDGKYSDLPIALLPPSTNGGIIADPTEPPDSLLFPLGRKDGIIADPTEPPDSLLFPLGREDGIIADPTEPPDSLLFPLGREDGIIADPTEPPDSFLFPLGRKDGIIADPLPPPGRTIIVQDLSPIAKIMNDIFERLGGKDSGYTLGVDKYGIRIFKGSAQITNQIMVAEKLDDGNIEIFLHDDKYIPDAKFAIPENCDMDVEESSAPFTSIIKVTLPASLRNKLFDVPEEARLTDNPAVTSQRIKVDEVVLQGEYDVVNGNSKKHLVGTFGVASCVALIIYDPESKIGALAHFDRSNAGQHESMERIFADLESHGANLNNLQITFIGSKQTGSMETALIIENYIKTYLSRKEIPIENLKLRKDFNDTSRTVKFDAHIGRTGELTERDMDTIKNDPAIVTRMMNYTPTGLAIKRVAFSSEKLDKQPQKRIEESSITKTASSGFNINSTVKEYIKSFEDKVTFAEELLAEFKQLKINYQAEEKALELARSELEKAKGHIKELERLARCSIKELSAVEFIEVLRKAEGAARRNLTSAQLLAFDILEEELKNSPEDNFNPEDIMFIPRSSWVYSLFGFDARPGCTVTVSDDSGDVAQFISVSDEYNDPLKIIRILLHEIVHMRFNKGRQFITQNKPEEFGLFAILDEAMVELHTNMLMEDISFNPKARKMFSEAGLENDRKSLIANYSIANAVLNAYPQERKFLDAMLDIWSDDAIESIDQFLVEGDSSSLHKLLGPGWHQILNIMNKIADYRHTVEYAIGLFVISNSIGDEVPKEKLAAGLLLLDIVKSTHFNDYSFEAPKLYNTCIYNGAIRLLKEVFLEDSISLDSIETELQYKFRKYAIAEFKKAVDANGEQTAEEVKQSSAGNISDKPAIDLVARESMLKKEIEDMYNELKELLDRSKGEITREIQLLLDKLHLQVVLLWLEKNPSLVAVKDKFIKPNSSTEEEYRGMLEAGSADKKLGIIIDATRKRIQYVIEGMQSGGKISGGASMASHINEQDPLSVDLRAGAIFTVSEVPLAGKESLNLPLAQKIIPGEKGTIREVQSSA